LWIHELTLPKPAIILGKPATGTLPDPKSGNAKLATWQSLTCQAATCPLPRGNNWLAAVNLSLAKKQKNPAHLGIDLALIQV